MRKYRWSTQKALDFVKQKRCYINPNAGFRKVLEQFEKYNYTQLLPNSKEKTIVIKQSWFWFLYSLLVLYLLFLFGQSLAVDTFLLHVFDLCFDAFDKLFALFKHIIQVNQFIISI
jgi:hypothetical protein